MTQTNIDLAKENPQVIPIINNQTSPLPSAAFNSVSGIGDFNGDGYDDIIVAWTYAESVSYVLFGNPNVNAIDINTLTLEQGFKIYGKDINEVSGAGDFNGDGYSDIIISTPPLNIAYVIFGKPSGFTNIDLATLDNKQGFSISTTPYDGAQNYAGISKAGDFNGDGFSDIIISELYYETSTPQYYYYVNNYLLWGKASNLVNIELIKLMPDQGFLIQDTNYRPGYDDSLPAANSLGDINNDGYDDIIIGEPYATPYGVGPFSGASYVIFGNAGNFTKMDLAKLSQNQGFVINGAEYLSQHNCCGLSGFSVSGAGDINKDGYSDIIIGAPKASTNKDDIGNMNGVSYLVYGKSSNFTSIYVDKMNPDQGFTINGGAGYDSSGYAVSSAGDINGDGYSDFLVSAIYAESLYGSIYTRKDAGNVYVIYGKESGFEDINLAEFTNDQGFIISGATENDNVGSSLSKVGDFNGDHCDDFIIGSYGADSYLILGQCY